MDKLFYHKQPDTWDYQWQFTCIMNGGLIIEPNQNLVENIGFDKEATHTKKGKSPARINNLLLKKESILPIKHETFLVRSKDGDDYAAKKLFSGPNLLSKEGFILKMKRITKFFIRLFISK